MPDTTSKQNQHSRKHPRRIVSAGRLLLLALLISVVQYTNTGSVTWLTDTFRWIERTTTGLAKTPDANPGKTDGDISWSASAHDMSGRVVKIADGDTLTIIDADRVKHKVRLFGIDTPERDQSYYRSATNALSVLVSDRIVGIDVKDTDSYGRTVGVVYIDGRSVNLQMVRSGHAWWYKRYAGRNQPLREAEEHARASKLGLWAAPNPTAPWEWRRQHR